MWDGFYFDGFFDLPESALPKHCKYYFNILTITVGVPVGTLKTLTGMDIREYDDISKVTDPRPIYLYIYEKEELEDWEIEANSHTVIEVNTKTNEISWYDLIDFETKRPWAIEPIEEDFDYDDDDDDPENWDDDDPRWEEFDDENGYWGLD